MSTLVPPAADPASNLSHVWRVYTLYRRLVSSSPLREDAGLGGKLLFAGGMDLAGRDLLYASNIAGAASLAVSADPNQQRQAIRDGIVDFVVTSLGEALRILKNEVRKKQAVSVAVAADPRRVFEEMLDRGVQPDLIPPRWDEPGTSLLGSDWQRFLDLGATVIEGAVGAGKAGAARLGDESPLISWTVNVQHARWLPRLDLCAQAALPQGELERHRWLRLAPRYLGRLAQRAHAVSMSGLELQRFRDQAAAMVKEQTAKDAAANAEPILVTIQPFAEL
jgi:hypothetical protein